MSAYTWFTFELQMALQLVPAASQFVASGGTSSNGVTLVYGDSLGVEARVSGHVLDEQHLVVCGRQAEATDARQPGQLRTHIRAQLACREQVDTDSEETGVVRDTTIVRQRQGQPKMLQSCAQHTFLACIFFVQTGAHSFKI